MRTKTRCFAPLKALSHVNDFNLPNFCEKIIITFLPAACLIFAAVVSDAAPLLKLEAPQAPFAKEADASLKTETFKPKIEGNKIISGNKALQVRDDGMLYLFAGDEGKPIKIDFGFQTAASWGNVGMSGGKPATTTYDKDSQSFTLTANYPLDKANADGQKFFKLTQTVALMPDGIISISASWDVPEKDKENFKVSYWGLEWEDNGLGKKVACGGKEYAVSRMEGEDFWWFFSADKSEAIEFFPNLPKESFKLTPKVFSSLVAYSRIVSGDILQVQIKRKTDSNTISFNLDIRNAVSEKKSEQTYAGVDFKAIDCLELPDYKACRNLMVNPSFEQGMMFRDIHCAVYKPVWDSDVFSIDTENALFGKACLRIRSLDRSDDVVKTSEKDIPEAWRNQPGIVHRYIAYPRSLELTQIPLEPGTYTLSFYAKCDYPGKQKVAIGYGWESPTKEWKRYSGIIKEEKNRISFFQVEAFSDVKGGNIYIDGVQLEKGDKVTEFTEKPVSGMLLTSKPDNFLNCGDKVDARLKVMSQANASGKARVTAKDFYSENLFDKTFDFKCDKDGIAEIALPFEDKFPEGIFVVKADYTLDDGTRDYDFFRFSVMKFLENKHRLKNMFAYTLDGYNGMPNYPQILERYKRIGAGAISMETIWTKDLLDLYDKYGIDVLMFRMSDCGIPFLPVNGGVLFELSSGDRNGKVSLRDYRYNDPKAKLTEEYLRKYEDTVAKNAKDNPRVKAWKIDSELSAGGRYGMTREDFTKLQIAFYHGVKKGNPSAAVMQGGPCNMRPQGGIKDLEEELTLWSAVKYDLVGIHPYRNRPEDPDLDSDAAYLLNMLKKNNYDGTKVLWDEGMYYNQYHIPQLGYKCADWIFFTWVYGPLSYDMGWWEKISATWRARSWLVALKYQDRILTSTGGGEHNFSMDINLTPYASQKIPNTLGNLLGNAYFREDIRFAPYSRCYIFEDEQKRPVAAVWGYHAKLDDGTMPPFQASANFTGQTPEIFDLMGAGREAKADEKGNIAFPISSFPLFFRGKPGTLNTFVSTFRNAVLLSAEGLMPVEMYEEVATPDSMNVTIKNLVSKEYTGKLGVNDASYPFKIPPAEKSVISVKMPNVLKDSTIAEEKIKFQLTDSATGKDFKSFTEFKGFLCHKAKNSIVIDGNLDDWSDVPEIKLENRYPDVKADDRDFSASFKTVWNEKGIYLAVKVTDDKFMHNEKVELYTGNNPWHNRWNNDAMQVYFDTFCDARKSEAKGYGIDDYEYGIFPNSAGDSSVVYRYVTPDIQLTIGDKAPKPGTIAKEIESAFKKTKDGYVYEVFFPATWVLPIRLEKGYVAGFGIFLSDRDKSEEKEAKSLTLTPPGTGCQDNPHLYPAMLLWE